MDPRTLHVFSSLCFIMIFVIRSVCAPIAVHTWWYVHHFIVKSTNNKINNIYIVCVEMLTKVQGSLLLL